MQLVAEYISKESFLPYGWVISPDDEIGKLSKENKPFFRNANQGSAIKISAVSVVQNTSTELVPNLNIFRCFTKGILTSHSELVIDVPALEKHPNSSQTFIPVGVKSIDISHIVVTALPHQLKSNEPDLNTLKAFICRGNQSVTYGKGIWHAPMIAVAMDKNRSYVDFTVLIYEVNDSEHPELNCMEQYYKDPHKILVSKNGGL